VLARLEPETRRVAGLAFECACFALKLTTHEDGVRSLLASKIIELAKAGEVDPDRLCEGALSYLRGTAAYTRWTTFSRA
jgi:hypothetical protein